jgi:predicted transcriptional regulator
VEVHVHPTVVTRYGLWRMLSRMEMAEAEAVRGGLLTEEEVARLDASLRAKDEAGTFFAITSLVLVAGGIPSDAHPMPRIADPPLDSALHHLAPRTSHSRTAFTRGACPLRGHRALFA